MAKPSITLKSHASEYRLVYIASFKGVYLSPPFPTLDGVKFTDSGVWRNLRHMGWSVQRPSGQARQRDEQAIATWKKKRWPALKK